MMDKKEHLTKQGLDIIIKIKSLINNGLNNKVKDLSTILEDKVSLDKFDLAFKITYIPSPYWIVGFVAGEGSFSASPYNQKLKAYRARFYITQGERDLALLELIKIYLGTGKIYKNGDSAYNYEVSSYKINNDIILPFFIKYPLPSVCLKATNF